MTWPWRKGREPAPLPKYSTAALETFLEQARVAAAWQEARADAFERKASTLLGFVGVILVLMPTLRAPIANAHGHHWRMVLVGLAITAAVLLALAAASAALVYLPRKYATPDVDQLRTEWAAYAREGQAHLTPEQLTGLFVDQLIRRTDPSPLVTLREDANKRGRWVQYATWLVLAGVIVLGVLITMLLVQGGT